MPHTLHGALAESEERYRSVIAAMSEGVVLQDAHSTILACNSSAERLLGLSAAQMAGRSSLDPSWRAIHLDGSPFRGEQHPALATLRTGQALRNVEMGVYKPDGTLTWISVNTQPLFRDEERTPHAVVCTFSDITARRQAEVARQQSEERYRSIVETSLEGIWTIDLAGRTTFANARMARMLRCSQEQLAESSLWDFIEPGDRARVEQQLQQRSQGRGEEHEFCFLAKDGSHVWASVSACAITLPNGRPGALAMVRDISEQKQLLDDLQEARRLEAVGRLAGGVAHDFNNLLTAILTSVALAERGSSELPEHLKTIRVASERAAGFTKQLLAFARKQLILLRPLQVSSVVRELEDVLRRVGGEQIETVIEAPDTWPVLGDRSQLEQVLVNLVANARDAMPNGGRVVVATGEATLEAAQLHGTRDVRPGQYVVLSVRDSGGGIDETTRPHIFEPFFTTKTHGTGLGLSTCYGIVKQLGGHISVKNALGGGSIFEVYLPRGGELPSAPASSPVAPAESGPATLLIVEDDELVCDTLRRVLQQAGYTVLAATDGERAIALAAEHAGCIDLLITDVVMPKLSGRQLAERLTALRPDLQVLFVSGYLDQIVLPERFSGAATHFLAKPYTFDSVVRNVRELLDRAHKA
jgi:two-component system, cell cycle sensor histidine kinase and response regulator CckA